MPSEDDAPVSPTPLRVLLDHVGRVASSVLGVTGVLAAETILVALLHRDQVAGPWELTIATSHLLPVAAIAALPVAFSGYLTSVLLDRSNRPWARALLTSLVCVGAASAAYGVSHGRHLKVIAVRAAFIGLLVVGAGLSAWFANARIGKLKRLRPEWFALLAAALCGGFYALNTSVLPHLYPAFHMGLGLLSLLCAAWLGDALAGALPAWIAPTLSAVVISWAAIRVHPAIYDLPNWDNVRMLYMNHAPVMHHAVEFASIFTQPKDLATTSDSPTNVVALGARSLDWTGRDIVLVTVDALRADHLGLYGYERATSPNIDRFAQSAVVFERAYCPIAHTSYSISSLMTGKYMRPLLLQGVAEDSDTFAKLMRLYGYRTAGFYPPAVFSIDQDRFSWAESRHLDFEYKKVEYASADLRVNQVLSYLERSKSSRRLFLWVHFFEPHEPYVAHEEFPFGNRDIDLYDSEIASSDASFGRLVDEIRKKRPESVIILAADHGEEFADHGGYYHGTSVYEEQVRVPLIVSVPGSAPHRVDVPVQLIDIMPTVLRAFDIPLSPRLRGTDLGPWIHNAGTGQGMAFSESDDQTLLAIGSLRLICQRKVDACSLFDITTDPRQTTDVSSKHIDKLPALRARLRELEASHGRYELTGARLEGRSLPAALQRGIAGDASAGPDVASLLDDADPVIRRRAAEVLFQLKVPETAASLSLAFARDEDLEVKRWAAVALSRLGQGVPLTLDLLNNPELNWRRIAALALADAGDPKGEALLIDWWNSSGLAFERAKELAEAFAKIKSVAAVPHLCKSLSDIRLRPVVAATLAKIGEPAGRIALLNHFPNERYETSRRAIAEALVSLGATREMAPALVRFLGTPDPLPNGLAVAVRAKISDAVGGPDNKGMPRLRKLGVDGDLFHVVVPRGGNATGLRLLVRGRLREPGSGSVRVAPSLSPAAVASLPKGSARAKMDSRFLVEVSLAGTEWKEAFVTLPKDFPARPGRPIDVIVSPSSNVEVESFAVLPLFDEIPPPPPEPWKPTGEGDDDLTDPAATP